VVAEVIAALVGATRRSATDATNARTLLTEAELTMRTVRLPLILVTAAALVVAAFAVLAAGCGDSADSAEPKFVLTAADVQKAFADQGVGLAAYEIGPGTPALWVYPCAGCSAVRIVCLIFDFPVMARGYLTTFRGKRTGYLRAVRAKNVAVLIDRGSTPDEVQRTLRAVVELRHE